VDQPRSHRHGSRAGWDRRRHQLQPYADARRRARRHWLARPRLSPSVDGVEIVASLVLLAGRRARRKSRRLPWAALIIGTAARLAANIATADYGTISRIIAGWPAVALLIAVKLLSGMLEHRGPAAVSAVATTTQRGRPVPARAPDGTIPRRLPASAVGDDPAALEHAARIARDQLRQDGRPLTRDSLGARLRAAGYPVRNAALTPLLATLREEPAPAA
jgi:hypothetical protein